MHIVIDSIEPDSFELRGFTPHPSFRVRFHSQAVSGSARLVPASGMPDAGPGSEFDVEIAQKSVSAFRVCERHGSPRIQPLAHHGDFQVSGVVCLVVHPSEPPGNRITHVEAAGALFVLDLKDIGDDRPEAGACVEFIAHDVALWDDVI